MSFWNSTAKNTSSQKPKKNIGLDKWILLDKDSVFHSYCKVYKQKVTYYHCYNNPIKSNSFITLIYIANNN
jgi:hypothetical protein